MIKQLPTRYKMYRDYGHNPVVSFTLSWPTGWWLGTGSVAGFLVGVMIFIIL